ncbi:unnamed protein product [Didymodactylos carnosus]|uniref:RING-CH-type domain-containing protein n=2 Tax=Didymodactylos carnosus TaxID=1234261 RepID=A0A814YQL4_9BILA|nr:unnamed protein product [Didymodactylos carnosus]CAF3995604.1 unnamed protein product [Didymodactylos carnosus]
MAAINECDLQSAHNELKLCRICLDNDNASDIISPCLCSGGSAYVHRKCLNDWRSENANGRAFKFCDICQFEYVNETVVNDSEADRKRLLKYHLLVIRDLTLTVLLVQLVIIGLAYLSKIADRNRDNIKHLFPEWMNTFVIYYLSGIILFLALLGIFGLIVLCYGWGHGGGGRHNCDFISNICYRSNSGSKGGMFVIVVAIVLICAFIGIFVGIILSVAILKQSMKRHTNKLWLRQEAEKYIVKDFQERRNELDKYKNNNHIFTKPLTDSDTDNGIA